MTSYHNGFLYVSDAFGNASELINHARTAGNLEMADLPQVEKIADEGGCVGLGFSPCSMDNVGAVTEWVPLDFNDNPWGSAGVALEAYGLYIQEWTGLDGAHHTRPVHPQGGGHGGARFGTQYHRQRVMAFTVILLGGSERGLNLLFRWLESTLLSMSGPDCLSSIWLRDFCPEGTTDAELETGFLRADDVVLVDGPVWTAPPIEDQGCYLRSATFTLVAGAPCLFGVPTDSMTTVVTPSASPSGVSAYFAACGQWTGTGMQVAAAVGPPDFGLSSPVVTISAPLEMSGTNRALVPAQRIFAAIDDAGLGVLDPCRQRRVGMIVVQNLPSGFELVVDGSDGTAQARDLHGDRQWYDGAQYIANNADVAVGYAGRRATSIPAQCASGFFVVEPALGGSVFLGLPAASVSTYTVSIQATTRVGCI